jgi:hypothetical protein
MCTRVHTHALLGGRSTGTLGLTVDFAEGFSPPESLQSLLARLDRLPEHAWAYIPLGAGITLDTQCRVCTIDSRDFSPEEDDELDEFPQSIGLRIFLSKAQLEDIVSNLAQQVSAYSASQLVAAIDYYWRHDAFIQVPAS